MKERIITDTTNFFSIERGDIIVVEGKYYRVTGYERERRFGVEDPKFWVKRVIDTKTGEKKIIKLSFFESFNIRIGGMEIDYFRNPEKEVGDTQREATSSEVSDLRRENEQLKQLVAELSLKNRVLKKSVTGME